MAKQTKQSGLLGKALKSHASDKTTYGPDYSDLPGGITGGVAKLVEAKIGVYQKGDDKGKKFVFLQGTVKKPKSAVNVVKIWEDGKVVTVSSEEMDVEGLFTNQTLPLCSVTRKSGKVIDLDENVETALNEVRKVGGEECTEGIGSDEELAELLKSMKEEEIYFKFSTQASDPSAKYPKNPRVWENWRGPCEFDEEDEDDDVVEEDDTDVSSEPKEQEDVLDLSALGANADRGDESCQLKLEKLAKEAGLGDTNDYPTWEDVAIALNESDDDTEESPEKGEVFKYKPPHTRKAVDCEITAVFEKKQTCNLKNLETSKSYKSVSWDDLQE